MAIGLLSQYTAAQNTTFVQTVEMAIILAAIQIQAEATSFLNHTNRANYAKLVLNNPTAYSPLFTYAVASQGIDVTATDVAISNAIAAVWNALAGTI